MADASAVIIEELRGPELNVVRELILMGPALPFRGAEWGGEQRLATAWPPGNTEEAVQQVLGPIEAPSNWEGEWRTTRMIKAPSVFTDQTGELVPLAGNDIPEPIAGSIFAAGQEDTGVTGIKIRRASLMRDVFEAIVRSGSLLRVTWQQGDRKIVRLGRASSWSFPHQRADDIGWKVTWQWIGRGGRQQRVVTFRSEDVQRDMAATLTDLSAMTAELKTLEFSIDDIAAFGTSLLAFAKNLADTIDAFAERLSQIGELFVALATLPLDVADALVASAAAIRDSLLNVSKTLGQIPAELGTTINNKLSKLLKAKTFFADAQQNAEVAAAAAADLHAKVKRRVAASAATSTAEAAGPADIQGVHVCKQGETFASIAKLFLSSTEHGPSIAKANGFPGYQVAPPAGTVIVIPNLSAIQQLKK